MERLGPQQLAAEPWHFLDKPRQRRRRSGNELALERPDWTAAGAEQLEQREPQRRPRRLVRRLASPLGRCEPQRLAAERGSFPDRPRQRRRRSGHEALERLNWAAASAEPWAARHLDLRRRRLQPAALERRRRQLAQQEPRRLEKHWRSKRLAHDGRVAR